MALGRASQCHGGSLPVHGVGSFPQMKAGWGLGVRPVQCCHFTDGETEADFSCLVVGWGALDMASPLEASQIRTSSSSLVRQRQTMEKGIQAKGAACAGSSEVLQRLAHRVKEGCTAREETVAAPKGFSPERSPERELRLKATCKFIAVPMDSPAGTCLPGALLPPTGCITPCGPIPPPTNLAPTPAPTARQGRAGAPGGRSGAIDHSASCPPQPPAPHHSWSTPVAQVTSQVSSPSRIPQVSWALILKHLPHAALPDCTSHQGHAFLQAPFSLSVLASPWGNHPRPHPWESSPLPLTRTEGISMAEPSH